MQASSISRFLLISGTLLFLVGLLNGAAVQSFLNPRMGFSAHLGAVQGALVLWAFGLMWSAINLGSRSQIIAAWSAVIGMYTIWLALALALAGITGSSRDLPIAGKGYLGSPLADSAVAALLYTGALTSIIATIFVLFGLTRHRSGK